MPIDYSKWKEIEVSDDEDDTHPNIDTPSLFRWRHQARMERMAQKKQEKEEIDLGKMDSQRKINEIERKLKDQNLEQENRKHFEVEKEELEKQEQEWKNKEKHMEQKEILEPWNIDTIGHESFSKSRINKATNRRSEISEEEDNKHMREFFDKYDSEMRHFGTLCGFDACEKYLLENSHLASEYTANFLTIECLNLGMEFKDEEMCKMAAQTIIIQYIIELAKTMHTSPANVNMLRNFFKKIKAADPSYLKMYRQEVEAFECRIRKRAKEKRDLAIAEYEQQEKQKRIDASPGGLDPQQVYEDLPQEMRSAFDSQEVTKLQHVATILDKELFSYHLQRCIDSGLWLPDANKGDNEEPNDKEEESYELNLESKKDR